MIQNLPKQYQASFPLSTGNLSVYQKIKEEFTHAEHLEHCLEHSLHDFKKKKEEKKKDKGDLTPKRNTQMALLH